MWASGAVKRKLEDSTEDERCAKRRAAGIENRLIEQSAAPNDSTESTDINPMELYGSSESEDADESESEEFYYRCTAAELISKLKSPRVSLHTSSSPSIEPWTPLTPPSSQESVDSLQEKTSAEDTPPTRLLPLAVRKRIVLYDTPPELVASMQRWLKRVLSEYQGERDPDNCWLHPNPPQYLCKQGTMSFTFTFRHAKGKQYLSLQFGLVALLLAGKITDAQKRGVMEESCWHLSHLCGNWTCLNVDHFTIEKGSINLDRNTCFRRPRRCSHQPPCLKALKRPKSSLLPSKPPTEQIPDPNGNQALA